jgi:hypothetical protein
MHIPVTMRSEAVQAVPKQELGNTNASKVKCVSAHHQQKVVEKHDEPFRQGVWRPHEIPDGSMGEEKRDGTIMVQTRIRYECACTCTMHAYATSSYHAPVISSWYW